MIYFAAGAARQLVPVAFGARRVVDGLGAALLAAAGLGSALLGAVLLGAALFGAGLLRAAGLAAAGLAAGAVVATDFGAPGYGGPCPPKGARPHHYHFTLYALKIEKLDVPKGATASLIGYMANANSIGTATLTGKYGRPK